MTHPDSHVLGLLSMTFTWKLADVLIVVHAADEARAREYVAEEFRKSLMHLPDDFKAAKPTIMTERSVVWCWR